MTGWYRRFIENYAARTAPISDLLKKNKKKFAWNDEATVAFNDLKSLLVSAPILASPNYDEPFYVQTDASDKGVGGVLSQGQGDDEKVIAFMSQKLSSTQQKYSTTERECLAVILALEKFRGYIEGVKFTVVTDHASLLWMQTMKNPNGRLARWILRLQHFNFDIVHKKGKLNVVPDALSRIVDMVDFDLIGDSAYTDKLKDEISKNPDEYSDFKVENNQVFKHCKIRDEFGNMTHKWKVVVPKDSIPDLLKKYHDHPLAAHFGYFKTLKRIQPNYYWPHLATDVRNYVRNCETCRMSKNSNEISKTPAGKPKEATRPWEMISMDYLGPFPRSKSGNTMILVIIDWFSKFVKIQAMREAESKSLTKYVEEEIFLVYSVPEIVLSDNGKQFTGNMFQNLLKKYNVLHHRTPYYSPQSNNSERVNQELLNAIRSYIGEHHNTWDVNLKMLTCAINTAIHEATKFSPYFLNFGQEMNLEGNKRLKVNDPDDGNHSSHLQKLEKIRELVKENIKKAFEKQTKYYNLRSRQRNFDPNEVVLRRNFTLSNAQKGISSKLLPKFVKARIKSKNGDTYELVDMTGKLVGRFHARDLKKL